jgi:chemotaxis protein histidine kinase CheA
VRNSLDHGIELPENRIAAGKSPVGNLILCGTSGREYLHRSDR